MTTAKAPQGRRSSRQPDASRRLITMRLTAEDIGNVDKRAKRAKLTRTDYMIRKALDESVGEEDYTERLDDLERRLKRLEDVQFGRIS